MRVFSAERLLVETQVLAGQRALCCHATPVGSPPGFGGIQRRDLLAWYRAFDPREQRDVVEQYFTGAAVAAWMPRKLASAFPAPRRVRIRVWLTVANRRLQAGAQRTSLNIRPFASLTPRLSAVNLARFHCNDDETAGCTDSKSCDIGLTHDFSKRVGSLSMMACRDGGIRS